MKGEKELKKVVIRVTGSIFDFEEEDKINELISLIETIKKIYRWGIKLFIVTGGGRRLRKYMSFLRDNNVGENLLDRIGIEITRINALIFISLLGDIAYRDVPMTINEAIALADNNKVIVMGGLVPGFSTDAVSALVAEAIDAGLLILMSRAGGIYDKDPEKFKNAKKIQEIPIKRVREILSGYWSKAGSYPLLDHTAIEIISRSKIPTVIISPDPECLKKILKGERSGTKIRF